MKLERATEEEQKIGWKYSYQMLERIQSECLGYACGYKPCLEEIQAVIMVLEDHKIIGSLKND